MVTDANRSMKEDWFNMGKEDAWVGRPKNPPQDPEAASLYDLGYSEGVIERPTTVSDSAEANQAESSAPTENP